MKKQSAVNNQHSAVSSQHLRPAVGVGPTTTTDVILSGAGALATAESKDPYSHQVLSSYGTYAHSFR